MGTCPERPRQESVTAGHRIQWCRMKMFCQERRRQRTVVGTLVRGEGQCIHYKSTTCSTHLGDAPMSVAGLPVFSGPRVINSRQCIAPTGDLWSSVLHDGGYNREEEDEMVRLIT